MTASCYELSMSENRVIEKVFLWSISTEGSWFTKYGSKINITWNVCSKFNGFILICISWLPLFLNLCFNYCYDAPTLVSVFLFLYFLFFYIQVSCASVLGRPHNVHDTIMKNRLNKSHPTWYVWRVCSAPGCEEQQQEKKEQKDGDSGHRVHRHGAGGEGLQRQHPRVSSVFLQMEFDRCSYGFCLLQQAKLPKQEAESVDDLPFHPL